MIGLFYTNAFSALQYYDSKCTNDQLTIINGSSLISWGTVYPDKITLNKIKADDNGYIEFQIEQTNLVEVSLSNESNATKKFGFKFKTNGEAFIQNDGLELTGIPAITYVYADVFKVEKCDGQVCYFKNGTLLYCHCLDNTATVFVHTTDVTTASNARLTLEFQSDSTCNPAPRPQLVESNELLGKRKINTSKGVIKNKIVLANVYNKEGKSIKQFRFRTDREGGIPEGHSLKEYTDKKYKIVFKEVN